MLPLKDLLDILDKNKVKYNKKFKNIETICRTSERCEDFAKDTMGYIEELIKVGVNLGFDTVRQAISQLTELAVETSKPKAQFKLNDMIDERQSIMDNINKIKGEKKTMDVREGLIEYIDDSIACAYALAERTNDNNEKTTLENSASLLEELKRIVENQVFDVSSKEVAAKNRNLICFEIKPWRDKAADDLISSVMNDALINAQKIAMQWAAHKNVVSKNDIATAEDLVKINGDKLSGRFNTEKKKEECLAFFKKLNSYIDKVNVRKNNCEKDREKIKALQSEKAELERQTQEIQKQYMNGELSVEDVKDMLNDIKDEIIDKNEDIAAIRENKESNRELYKSMLGMAKGMKEFERYYNNLKDTSPYMIYKIFSNVDFNLLSDALDMSASKEKIEEFKSVFTVMLKDVAQKVEDNNKNKDDINTIKEEVRDAYKTETPKTSLESAEQRKAKEEKDKEDVDSLFGEILGGKAAPKQDEDTDQMLKNITNLK